ncbi:MAG TPA: hypothetical protein VKA63_07245 [Candidatus Krumholzibacteria bacterium]|nr:hypothetical protein [Candidatus Krumholzibacteria bacterium]
MRFPARIAALLTLLLVVCPVLCFAQMEKVASGDYEMSVYPDQAANPWTRIGDGAAILLDDGSLLINDNRSDDQVSFQTLLGQITASSRLVLSARLKALSNFDGKGSVLEFSRPHLQVALHFFADRMELVEMNPAGKWSWLATVNVNFFDEFHEVKLVKNSSQEPDGELVGVWLDGTQVVLVQPKGGSRLEVGRVIMGATSRPSMGASIWDWVHYDLDGLSKGLPADTTSFGSLKAGFTSP